MQSGKSRGARKRVHGFPNLQRMPLTDWQADVGWQRRCGQCGVDVTFALWGRCPTCQTDSASLDTATRAPVSRLQQQIVANAYGMLYRHQSAVPGGWLY